MNLGADDYQTKPVGNDDFSSTEPLVKLGLTPRAAEILLWVAQGKTNPDIASILGFTESTAKKHVPEVLEKLGVETRGAATMGVLEVLNGSVPIRNS